MPLAKSRTRVHYDRTIDEIRKILVKAGAQRIVFDYELELPTKLSFSYPFQDEMMYFTLPLRFNGIRANMKAQKVQGGDEQALNIGWRVMKDWVLSQLTMVDAEIAELSEVFFSYGVTKDGQSIYEFVKNMSKDKSPLMLGK